MKALVVCALVAEADQSSHDDHDICSNLADFDITIAVDAGAQWFFSHGVVPDFVVGDFDSIDSNVLSWLKLRSAQFRLVSSDKDFSDLELALCVCEEQGVQSAMIMGAVGGRLDHQLCVLGALCNSSVTTVTLMGSAKNDQQTVRLVRAEQQYVVLGIGTTFSAISLQGANISIAGARWPLNQVQLEPLSAHGLSNEVTSPVGATVTIHHGTALLIF